MKKIAFAAICIALSSAPLALTGCTSPTNNYDQDDQVSYDWPEGAYPGSDTHGISDEMADVLQSEYEIASGAGKGESFLKAIMGFGRVTDVKEGDDNGTSPQLIYLYLGKEALYTENQEILNGEGVYFEDGQPMVDQSRPIYLDQPRVFLDGEPAELSDIEPGYLASYWGPNMQIQPQMIYPPYVENVTLVIALSNDGTLIR